MQAEKDSEPQADSFAEVFQNELGEIKKRRRHAGYNESDSEALDGNLVGLALSGGGIRSATFCLGLLQGLRHLKLLHMFDYISTVSGGGYIGGWWSAWLSRNRIELRRKARSVKFKVDHIKSPAHLAVSLRFPETRISEYIFKKLNAGTQDLLKKHCVPKAAPPSHLSHVLERALSEEPEFKFFESLPEDAKRYLKHYCRPDRAASEALAKVLVYELNELLKDPSILQNILKSGRVVEQLLDDSELMEFLRSLPYQNSDSCVVPVSEEREIVGI
jgi:hypothetical protein